VFRRARGDANWRHIAPHSQGTLALSIEEFNRRSSNRRFSADTFFHGWRIEHALVLAADVVFEIFVITVSRISDEHPKLLLWCSFHDLS
jgi:hypothetical protein